MPTSKRANEYAHKWNKGDGITAKRLNTMSRNINALSEGLTGPKQQGAKEESDENESDLVFTEIDRTETTTEITDSNGDTFDNVVIDQVVFQTEDGRKLTLNFDNP